LIIFVVCEILNKYDFDYYFKKKQILNFSRKKNCWFSCHEFEWLKSFLKVDLVTNKFEKMKLYIYFLIFKDFKNLRTN